MNSHSTDRLPNMVNAAMLAIRQQHARDRRPAEHRHADRAGGRAVDGQDQDEEEDVGCFEGEPRTARPGSGRRDGSHALSHAREQEGHDANEAQKNSRERHGERRRPRGRRHEEFRQLAARRVAAADDDGLERESRQQEALEPGRLARQARQASTVARAARRHAWDPRPAGRAIADVRCISVLASAAAATAVLKQTPAQRIFGLVSAPIARWSAIASGSDGVGKSG